MVGMQMTVKVMSAQKHPDLGIRQLGVSSSEFEDRQPDAGLLGILTAPIDDEVTVGDLLRVTIEKL